MCTGACLRAAARHWAQLGLGPGAHNSPATCPRCSCGLVAEHAVRHGGGLYGAAGAKRRVAGCAEQCERGAAVLSP